MLVRPQVLQGSLTGQNGQTGDVAAKQRDIGLEEGQHERPQREVGHLLQHLVEIRNGNRASLEGKQNRINKVFYPVVRDGKKTKMVCSL